MKKMIKGFMDNSQRIGIFWDEDEMHKISGEPCYLLEHKNEPKWISSVLYGYTTNANEAWFSKTRKEAEDLLKNDHFVLKDLPIKITEHIFES